jgi:hypothetical protein
VSATLDEADSRPVGITLSVSGIESAIGVEFVDRPGEGRAGDRSKLYHVASGPTQSLHGYRKVGLCNRPAVVGNHDDWRLACRLGFVTQDNCKSSRYSAGEIRVETLMQISHGALIVEEVLRPARRPCGRDSLLEPFGESLGIFPMRAVATRRIAVGQSCQMDGAADRGRFAGAL